MALNIVLLLVGGVLGYAAYAIRLRLRPIPQFILRALFDAVPRAIIVFRPDKRYHYLTPYVEKLLGIPHGQPIGKTHQELVDLGIKTPALVGLDEALTGDVYEEPLMPTLLGGETVGWRKGVYWPVRNERGAVVNAIFAAQRMEEAFKLIEDTHRQSMILASVKDAIIVVDLDYRITDWNLAAELLYGFSAQEAFGQTVRELVRSDITVEEREQSRNDLRQKGFWQGKSIRFTKSGQRLIIESRASRLHDKSGAIVGYVSLDTDITDQAEMEDALRLSEERYRSLFENALEGIFRCTLEGQFTEVNPALVALLGYESAEEVLTLHLPEYVRLLIQQSSPQVINVMDVSWQKKNGALLIIDVSAHRIADEDNKPLYFDGTIADVTERKQAEAALRQSEERFRALVENGTDIISVLDSQGKLTYISPSVQRVLGYSPDDFSNAIFYDFVHPDDVASAREFFAQVARAVPAFYHNLFPLNVRIRHKDGTWRDIEITRNNSPLNYPSLQGIAINARDVTERNRVNEKLRRQNEYLTALNETTLSLIERLDIDELLEDIIERAGTLLEAPQGYIFLLEPDGQTMKTRVVIGLQPRLKGYRIKRGQGLSGRVWDTGRTIVVNNFENWNNSKYDFKSRHIRASIAAPLKSGTQVVGVLGLTHTNSALTFSADEIEMFNRFAELASIALDNARLYSAAQKELVDRTRADEELRQLNAELEERVKQRTAELGRREAQLSGVLDAMGEGVFFSEAFFIRYTNRALAEMTGYKIEELINQPNAIFKSVKASPEDAARFTEEFVTAGQVWRGELTIRRKDGTEFPAGLTVALVADANADIFGAVTVVRDITQEKELAEQKSAFLANASHELRTPLTNFKTRLYLLRKQPERLNDHVAVLDRVTDRMTSLVEDLLDASRFDRGVIPLQHDVVLLQPLIEDVVLLQQPEAHRKNIRLTTHMPDDPVYIYGDANRIIQVVVNLVVNAINYTSDEGSVSVELLCQERNALIRVSDTGMGITPEHLPRIFEAFFRGSEGSIQGTGLGLFISKEIVDLHGGSLVVESKVGEGTTFTVCLPLSENPPMPEELAASS